MNGISPGPRHDLTKALSDNPSGFRTWRRLRSKAPATDDAQPSEQIIKGASASSIAEFAALPRPGAGDAEQQITASRGGRIRRLAARMLGR